MAEFYSARGWEIPPLPWTNLSPPFSLECGGYLMGIGTHLGTVTFYHCIEDLNDDFPFNVYSDDSPFDVRCIDWSGEVHALTLSGHGPSQSRIDRPGNDAIRGYFTNRFERKAGLEWFTVGQTKGWFVAMPPMYEECLAMLAEGVTIYTNGDELPNT